VTIHSEHPFLTPEPDRNPLRRLRGRLAAPVTLWAAGSGPARAGLTVSSTQVVDGEPGRLLGLIDEDSDLWDAVSATGCFTVALLSERHRQLADQFAGVMPAPGGPFKEYAWRESPWGPVLADVSDWAGCRLDSFRPMGWSLLVEATVEHVELGSGDTPLLYHRGRYRSLQL